MRNQKNPGGKSQQNIKKLQRIYKNKKNRGNKIVGGGTLRAVGGVGALLYNNPSDTGLHKYAHYPIQKEFGFTAIANSKDFLEN